jgi:hypothetical protein
MGRRVELRVGREPLGGTKACGEGGAQISREIKAGGEEGAKQRPEPRRMMSVQSTLRND